MEILNGDELETLKNRYSDLPIEYLDWLGENGWGEHKSGYMFYSAPVSALEIFGVESPNNFKDVLLIGDDMCGYSIGYIKENSKWLFIGIDSCGQEIEKHNEKLNKYLES